MKVFKAFYSFIVVTFVLLALSALSVFAVSSERESNDTYTTATYVSFGDTVKGKISSYYDVDYYKISVNSKGYISIKLDHVITDDYVDWKMSIYKYNNALDEVFSDYLRGREINNLPRLGVEPGTYYIKISDGDNSSGYDYQMTVKFTASDYWESELNDSYLTADTVKLNKTYGGFTGKGGNEDYFKFTPSYAGYLTIKLDHLLLSENAYWKINVYKYNDALQEVYYSTFYADEINKSPKIGVEKGKTYYVKISTYYNVDGVEYKMTFGFSSTTHWESEQNDTYLTADTIKLQSLYGGFIGDGDSCDYFKFTLNSAKKISLAFFHNAADDYDCWDVELYKLGSSLKSVFSKRVYGDKTSYVSDNISLSSGTYYIKVTGIYINNIQYKVGVYTGLHTKYTVKYHLSGGKNSSKNPASYRPSLTKSISLHTPTLKGYTFKGWYTDSAKTKKITKIEKGTTGNIELWAKWERKTYTISYHLSGGKNSSKNPSKYTYSSSKDVALHTPTRTGYTFKGWYTDSARTKRIYKIAGGTTGDLTLYAKWEKK